ncbi:hypothetical protein CBL_05117 [Carabus blaptoides fortunei]
MPKTANRTINATTPLKCVDTPSYDRTDGRASIYDVLRYVTAAILNAAPDQWKRMQPILCGLAARIFETKMVISYSGSKLHVGCTQHHHENKGIHTLPTPTRPILVGSILPSKQLSFHAVYSHLNAVGAIVHTQQGQINIVCLNVRPSTLFIDFISTLDSVILIGGFNARHQNYGDLITNGRDNRLEHILTELPLFRIPFETPTTPSKAPASHQTTLL